MTGTIKPGYVYVLSNQSLPHWFKVGRTSRPPFRRAQELSKTSLPTPFHVEFAKFFEDSTVAERNIHTTLVQRGGISKKRKEFFNLSTDQIIQTVLEYKEISTPNIVLPECPTAPIDDFDAYIDSESFDDLEDYDSRLLWMEEAEHEWITGDPWHQAQAWMKMEKLSATGFAHATWRLAEWILILRPNPSGAQQASWVFEAAELQGSLGGKFRASWLRSWGDPQSFSQWIALLECTYRDSQLRTPHEHRAFLDVIEMEMDGWNTNPERSRFPIWMEILQKNEDSIDPKRMASLKKFKTPNP